MSLVADAASDFGAVAKTAEVKVSADGMPTLTQALTVTATGITGTVTGIVAGTDRMFEVFVYDASKKLCYYGKAMGEATAGGTANIALTLYKTNGEGIGDHFADVYDHCNEVVFLIGQIKGRGFARIPARFLRVRYFRLNALDYCRTQRNPT